MVGGDKAPVGRKSLGEAADDHVNRPQHPLQFQGTAADWPKCSKIMCHVHQQRGPVAVAQVLQGRQIGNVAVHAEQPFGDQHDAGLRLGLAQSGKATRGSIGRQMRNAVDIGRGGHCPFLQTGMGQNVDHDLIVRSHQCRDGPITRAPASREHGGLGIAYEGRDGGFQSDGQAGRPHQRSGASRMDAEPLNGLGCGRKDEGMGRQAEVILIGEFTPLKGWLRRSLPLIRRPAGPSLTLQ